MQILINLIAFFFGIAIGYLYGYYVRSRRAIKRLNESIDRTRREQEQLRAQYAEMRAILGYQQQANRDKAAAYAHSYNSP